MPPQYIFPLCYNSKTPAADGWTEKENYPFNSFGGNYGVPCGLNSLVVVDVDCYKSSAEVTLETILQMGSTDALLVT